MTLVAVLAVILGAGLLGARWHAYRRQADHHEELASALRGEITALETQGLPADEVATLRGALAEETAAAERFRQAQQRPWQPLPTAPR